MRVQVGMRVSRCGALVLLVSPSHLSFQVDKDSTRLLWLNLQGLKTLSNALQIVFSLVQRSTLWMPTDAEKLAKANTELKKVGDTPN